MSDETATISVSPPSQGESTGGASDTSNVGGAAIFSEGNVFVENWAENLEGEEWNRDTLGKFDGKSVTDLARSYAELEKKIGQKTEGMIKVPGDESTEEERAAFHAALGVPDSAEDYEISLPDEVTEGLDWDEGVMGPIKEAAHRIGVSPAQLSDLVAAQAQIEKEQVQLYQQEQEQAQEALRREWGVDAEKNAELVQRGLAFAGVDLNNPSPTDTLKLALAVGQGNSEGSIDPLTSSSRELNDGDLARDIQTNSDNPLYKAYRGEIPDRAKVDEARQKVAALQKSWAETVQGSK
jgi:hypothetical protein